MHVVQLVQIDITDKDIKNKSEIISATEIALDFQDTTWFDWFAVGGRWEDHLNTLLKPQIWPNSLDNSYALQINKENKSLVLTVLEEHEAYRKEALKDYSNALKEMDVDLNEYFLNPDYKEATGMMGYYLRRIMNFRENSWDFDSGYVDITNYCDTNIQKLIDYVKDPENSKDYWDNNLDNHALVVVDFHF